MTTKNDLRVGGRRMRLESWRLGVMSWGVAVATAAIVIAAPQQQQPPTPPTPPQTQQPSEVALVITGDPGTPPRYAVPDFVALSPDAAEIAKTIG